MTRRHEQLEKTFNLPSLSDLTDEEIEDVEDVEDEDYEDYEDTNESYEDLRRRVESMSKKLSEYDSIGELSSSVTKKYNEDIDSLHRMAKEGYEEIFTAALTMDPAHGSKFLSGAAKLLELALRSKNSSIEKQLDMAKLQLEREKMHRHGKPMKAIADIDDEDEDATSYGVGENGGPIYDRNEIIRQLHEDTQEEPPKGDEPS